MSEFKGTPGPLFVRQPEEFPFNIEIIDKNGDVIFMEKRHAYGTGQKTIKDVMSGYGFKQDIREEVVAINERQLADAYIRASSPELLEALIISRDYLKPRLSAKTESFGFNHVLPVIESAIAKATGKGSDGRMVIFRVP